MIAIFTGTIIPFIEHMQIFSFDFQNKQQSFKHFDANWEGGASDVILPAISFNIFFIVCSYPPAQR